MRSPFEHPSLTLVSRVSAVGVLKRHDVGERAGELRADFSSCAAEQNLPRPPCSGLG
jgi:hypothetical protein